MRSSHVARAIQIATGILQRQTDDEFKTFTVEVSTKFRGKSRINWWDSYAIPLWTSRCYPESDDPPYSVYSTVRLTLNLLDRIFLSSESQVKLLRKSEATVRSERCLNSKVLQKSPTNNKMKQLKLLTTCSHS